MSMPVWFGPFERFFAQRMSKAIWTRHLSHSRSIMSTIFRAKASASMARFAPIDAIVFRLEFIADTARASAQ